MRKRVQSWRAGGRSVGRRLVLAVFGPIVVVLGLALPGTAVSGASEAGAAGGTTVTTLRAAPVSVVHTLTSIRLTYSARLTVAATGAPIGGQYVLFEDTPFLPNTSPLANLICDPQTNVLGVASCTISILRFPNALERPTYTAIYFGSSQYLPSVAEGRLGP
jgi:hypothetical protein